MPPRNFGNRNPGIQCLGDDPPLLLRRPAAAASHSGAYLHPPKRDLRVAYSVSNDIRNWSGGDMKNWSTCVMD